MADAFVLSSEWGMTDLWNEIADECDSDEEFNSLAKVFIQAIPYPSKRVTSLETVNLLLALITHANAMTGREATILSLNEEKKILRFATCSIENKEFSKMIHESVNQIGGQAYQNYLSVYDALTEKDIRYFELIIPYVDACINSTESGLDFKAKTVIKKSAKGVAQIASAVHGKVKHNAQTVLQKSTRGVSHLTSTIQSKVKENVDLVTKKTNMQTQKNPDDEK